MIKKADSLFSAKEYYEASLLYQKASYFSYSEKNKALLILKKAECLKQSSMFSDALECMAKINLLSLNDTVISLVKYQEGLCAYLAQDYQLAESHLLQIGSFTKDSSLILPSLPLYALSLNELKRWPEAQNKIICYINNSNINSSEKDTLIKNILSLYDPINYPKLKKPQKARVMSQILPGLGQCYAGYYKEGISSFLINTSIVAGAAVGIIFHYYFTSVIFGNALLAKFYIGNINRAEFLTNKHNYLSCKDYNGKLKAIILESAKR